VGAVVVHDRRLLLVQRGNEPGRGLWSVPGGRLEPGETVEEGCAREVLEEAGITVRPGRVVGRVERDAPGGGVYVIDDLDAVVVTGAELDADGLPTLTAGDDADDAWWATVADLDHLPLVPLLRDTLEAWGVLTRLR
jgi:ADP-ribose pyrophosphatase YjhB (NUDIX family)